MVFLAEESILHVVAIASAILFITSVSGSDWPSGWYGLPEPKSGCPSGYRSEWGSGWWYEDRRLNNQSTARVPQYSHLKGTFTQEVTKRYFCMKKKDNGLNRTWPDGQYCIYQGFLKPCPPCFVKGSIGWKNKDAPNKNTHSGGESINLPNGVFVSDTRINYCCRVDGSKENIISLPINRPFLLLAYNSSQCQSVKWARTTQEYLRFSVQENMTFRGFHPFVDDNYTLRYCYYQSSNQTVTSPNGIVSQYLNQTSIHQDRYTAWHIHPQPMLPLQFLVLRFTRFIFHASNITSYLKVFDGPNESAAALLGRFSSTQSPLGRNLTSTNQLLVVLNFDDRNGTYDFEFNYHIIHKMTTVTTTLSTSQPHTSSESVTSSSPYTSPSSKTSQPHTSSESVTSSSPYTSPSSTSQPHTSSESVTSSSPYTSPSIKTSQPHTSYDVTSSPTTTPGYLRYHDNGGKSKYLLSILLPIGGLVIVLLVLTVVLLKRRRRRRYSRMDVSVYDSEHELDDDMDGYFEEIQLSPVCSLLQLTNQPVEESRTISNQANNESLPSEQEQFNGQQHDVPLETECHNIDPSASTSQTNQNESDPGPCLFYYILGNDFNANDSEESESKEAESIELMTLLKENQNELVLQKSPQEKDTKIKATQC